ncbi:MAG TPA: primosomal protein N' [Candidatus Eisenbacteria bacterium]|nr:primosomal protein N' [Candidatus Eisenbacteria bacterium]
MNGLVEIAPLPPVPQHDLFTYLVPTAMREHIQVGMRVRVPLGRQTRTGLVAGFTADAPARGDVRTVLDLLDTAPFVPADLLELCRWTARYYLASLAEVIGTIVPGRVPEATQELGVRLLRRLDPEEEERLLRRAPARAAAYRALAGTAAGALLARDAQAAGIRSDAIRGLVIAGLAERFQQPAERTAPAQPAPAPRPPLTSEQQAAADAIADAVRTGQHASFVLHGITGSGKTEVFLAAAEATLAAGRDVLVLVPEIALTHQAVARVRERFGDTVAVLHSGLGPRERWSEWRRIVTREARVVVGARSAVFAPVGRLGLVVVDEEHDGSYKQEDGIRYHARDLAVVRARLAGGVVVLASATPSAETYHAATTGRHRLLELHARPTAQPLPAVDLVDLRGRPRTDEPGLFSDELRAALDETIARGEQALVFLNRRGFATYLQCPSCGATASCPHCSVTLTWHRARGALACHHCQFHRRPPARCESCQGPPLEAYGIGTERIEATLRAAHPGVNVERLDRDVAARAGAQRRILRDWHDGSISVLVGTQMVSKGHDVPGVTLVAVLLADQSLNVPDFRAAERTFQLLVQVAGRAGRGARAGRVIVQTLRPTHPSLVAARTHDYRAFVTEELARRKALGYPPFARLVLLRLDGKVDAGVERAARGLAQRLRAQARALGMGDEAVLGPAPPPVERVRGRYRWQLLLRHADVRSLRALARAARGLAREIRQRGLRLVVDVDPVSM